MSLSKGLVFHAPLDKAHSKADNMMLFDGVDDFINIGHDVSIDTLSQITMMAWVFETETPGSNFVSKHGGGWEFKTTKSQIKVGGSWSAYTSTVSPTQNTWNHVAITYDGSELIHFLNGVAGTAVTGLSGSIASTTTNISIGSYSTLSGFLNGIIDQFVIYSTGFSPSTITELKNYGLGGNLLNHSGTVSAMSAYYRNSGTRDIDWLDRSTNTNNGTVVGSPSTSLISVPSVPLDITPNRNNGINHGATIRNHGVKLVNGGGAADDYVTFASQSLTGDFTISMWTKSDDSDVNNFLLTDQTANNQISWYDNNFTVKIAGNSVYPDAGLIEHNNWRLFTITRASDTVAVYDDGISLETASRSGTFAYTTIGWDGGTDGMSGNISDFLVYDRALSAAEVKDLYNGKHIAGAIHDVPFDGDYNDKSGNDKHGTNVGATMIGTAADFDGTNDYIDFGDVCNLGGSADFTFTAWAKTSDWTDERILGRHEGANDRWHMGANSSDQLLFYSKASSTVGIYYQGATTLPNNEWVHLALVADRSSGTTGYVNGVYDDKDTDYDPDLDIDNDGNFLIGQSENDPAFFNGEIKDVRFYNRALSADEIGQLYRQNALANTGAIDTLHKGLVADFPLTSGNAKLEGYTTFDGVNDYIDVGDIDYSSYTELTISCWINLATNADCGVVSNQGAAGGSEEDTGFTMRMYTDKRVLFYPPDSSQLAQLYYTDDGLSGGTQLLGSWHHVAVTLDKTATTGFTKLYLDGVLKNTATPLSTQSIDNAYNTNIGRNSGSSPGGYFDGEIADVRIYNKALSAAQVTDLYNGKNVTDGLVSRYPLVPSMGDAIFDISGETDELSSFTKITGDTLTYDSTNKYYIIDPDGSNDYVIRTTPTFTAVAGDIIKMVVDAKLASGVGYMGFFKWDGAGTTTTGGTTLSTSVWTTKTYYFTMITGAGSGAYFDLKNADTTGNVYFKNLSIKKLNLDYNDHYGSNNGTNSGSVQNHETLIMSDKSVSQGRGIVHGATVGSSFTSFDGTDDYISTGDIAEMNNVSALSISGWIKPDMASGADVIYSKDGGDGDNRILCYIDVSGTDLYVEYEDGGINQYGKYESFTTATYQNVWTHFAIVFDGSGSANADRLKLYLNGVNQTLAFTGTISATTTDANGEDFLIGRSGSDYFDGNLAQLRIYNRALSRKEINQLMRETNPQ